MADKEALALVEETGLVDEVTRLLDNPAAAKAMGERGQTVFEEQAGATGRTAAAIQRILDERGAA
jgi:3-deoxy-D-manno-octulosonic-acid transferase